jgi:putative peptide zinc metalloprotease protein
VTRSRFRWLRLFTAGAVLGALATAVLMQPVTRRVKAPAVFNPAQSYPLFAVAAGELAFAVAPGDWVEANQVVAHLKNPDLELALLQQRGTVREQSLRLEQLETLQAAMPAAAKLIPAAAAALADAEAQLAEQEAIVETLTVRAPAAGRVLPPPERTRDESPPDSLRTWHGTPLEQRNVGAWIELGTPLAVIAPPGEWTALAAVEQGDVSAVDVGQPVRFVLTARGTDYLAGRVTHVARRARRNAPPADAPASQPLGDARYHVVEVKLNAANPALLPGARGTAKIETHESTLGQIVADQLRRTFRRVF